MIAIIDYDAGNIKSVEKALLFLGADPVVTRDPDLLRAADHVILPGVGAFGDAMKRLQEYNLIPVIHEIIAKGTPFLGICLGLQLLFESSEESPGAVGLNVLPGKILKLDDENGTLKVPHIGWNSLHFDHPGDLFRDLPENMFTYFVHSYYLKAADPSIVTASAEYGSNVIHASVQKGNVYACQFHPEKSSDGGLTILKNFLAV